MDKNNKIPQCVFIPYTNNNCSYCDGCNRKISTSKLGERLDLIKNWNCSRRSYSLLLTYIIFGLSVFFTPFYQIQFVHQNLCICTSEFTVLILGFLFSFLAVPFIILLIC